MSHFSTTPQIIPAILAKNRAEFTHKLKLMEKRVPLMQVDVMDGAFVPNHTWFNAKSVSEMDTKMQFELHLMVNDPITVMTDWMKVKGLRRVIFHIESPLDIPEAVALARAHCLEVGLAICPDTSLSTLTPFLSLRAKQRVDLILVMGGKPGFSGKPLDSNTIDTVRALRKKSKTLPIGFDIGVSRETIPTLITAGVTNLCVGSAIFNAKNPAHELVALQKIADQASG